MINARETKAVIASPINIRDKFFSYKSPPITGPIAKPKFHPIYERAYAPSLFLLVVKSAIKESCAGPAVIIEADASINTYTIVIDGFINPQLR
ncbi:hypothetical protein SDC9_109160 [bioreactor metagenome]|uniref:Uncharacterized protein n=1 Tax=bioreactor metagenome TaxID=1076179 RepID=A0A645BKH0_9ZZZZ